ncbi:hypothetical protein DVH05_026228 [Phytophthora capsici]|nr:hypothetical protein DVH05_026228 [Phytophthora capsici]
MHVLSTGEAGGRPGMLPPWYARASSKWLVIFMKKSAQNSHPGASESSDVSSEAEKVVTNLGETGVSSFLGFAVADRCVFGGDLPSK